MYSLVSLDRAREAIKSWARELGLIIQEVGPDYVILLEGDNEIYVKLFFPSELADPDELTRIITEIARIRDRYNKVYLAVPQNIADLIDGKLVKRAEIGVLVLDTETLTVQERVRSPVIRRSVFTQLPDIESKLRLVVEQVVNSMLASIRSELTELKRRVQQLEEAVRSSGGVADTRLRQDVERLWDVVDRLKTEIARLSDKIAILETSLSSARAASVSIEAKPAERVAEVKPMTAEVVTEATSEQAGLPDFLVNNPWIAILRQKASERTA